MALKINTRISRNAPKQILKNKEDIEEIKSTLQPYISEGDNVVVEYNEDFTHCTISATLNTAIDDHLDGDSTNPVQNKVIYRVINDINTDISNITNNVANIETSISNLQRGKQDSFTLGSNLNWNGNELNAVDTNTYPIPTFHTGLQLSNSSDSDNNKKIFVPYATDQQAGVVNKTILTPIVISTIQTILPQIAPLFFPKAGEIIQTINSSYNPNNEYQGTTWRKFKDGLYFSSGSTFEHRGEQLPNITGEIEDINARGSSGELITKSGALSKSTKSNGNNIGCGNPKGDVIKAIKFDASKSNSIYTNNGVVRPNTITTYSWIRVDGLSTEVMNSLEQYLQ